MQPVEPGPSRFAFDLSAAPAGEDFLGIGADLEPATLLAAYRAGAFPMPVRRRGPMGWFSPDPRGVIPLDGLRVSRSLRAACRRYEVRFDTAYDEVVRACADPRRPGGWIRRDIVAAYRRLHDLGWAHSVEAWAVGPDGRQRLAGGLYGVAVGGLFAGESMFHRERDASKVALVGLVDLLRTAGGSGRLLDVQWATEHLVRLGAVEVSRPTYLAMLSRALELPPPDFADTASSPG
ncbi:MAG TPA: leucyl/phenylalanyl-tRNA--protein transferase [Actinomycetes bacterium]